MYSGKLDTSISAPNDNTLGTLCVMDCTIGIQVKQISCGGQHCAIVTNDGKVLTWGKGSYGRLGHGNLNPIESPTEVQSLVDLFITKVTCGFAFTSAITKEGSIYSWGANENGRLGLGDTEDKTIPVRVNLNEHKVIDVCAGSVHSCVLTSKGLVFTYGKLEYSGHASTESGDILFPMLLDHFDGIPIKQISSGFGGYHTLALTERGSLYAWGHNRVSQTGIPNTENTSRNAEGAFFITKPTIVELSERVKNIACGWGHSVIVSESGKAFSCGRNTDGQLGIGNQSLGSLKVNERGHTYQPYFRRIKELENLDVLDVSCGGEHSVFRIGLGDDSNAIYSCGSNAYGQLCQKMDSANDQNCFFYEPVYSKQLKEVGRSISQIECAGESTLFKFSNYIPSTLKEICTTIIQQNPEKYSEQHHFKNIKELANYYEIVSKE